MKKLIGIFLVLVLVLPAVSFAQSQPASVASSDSLVYKWGGALRVRNEYWRNTGDMNNQNKDNRNFFRVKSSLWGQVDYEKSLSFYTKLTDEFRAHTYFGGTSGSYPDKTASKKGYHFDINEIVVDNMYLDMKGVLDMPVDLRIGRQDFLGAYGEGFLIMDGTPGDGSRTFYFNAAKAAWKIDEKNSMDFIYINDPRDEEFFPVINRVELERRTAPQKDKALQSLNTSDEEAFVLYWKNKAVQDLNLEGYYIFKKEAEEGGAGLQSQKGEINTLGSFAKYNMSPFTLRGQLAYQFGDYGDEDREGIGGYAWVDHDFKDAPWSPQASIGYVYLSGDDKDTDKMEAFNPLFSRFPSWSELYLLSLGSETKVVGYWTNLSMFGASLSFKPTEKMKLSFKYYILRANEYSNPAVSSPTVYSGDSKDRGQMPQVRIDYTFDKKKNITGYTLAEYFIPGDFYVQEDPAMFVRTEIQIKF